MPASNRARWAAAARRAALPIALLIAADVAFPHYFWRIPKLTGRSADYGYQFLIELNRAVAPRPPDTPHVVAFGSSVTQSFEPYQIESLLTAADGRRVDVQRLFKPGMKPSDWSLLFRDLGAQFHPSLVLFIVTYQDFLNPSFDRELKKDVQYVLPPWATLRERGAQISDVSDRIDLLLASLSNFYRYRRPIRAAIQDHARAALQWLRGATPQHAYGCYPDGYARRRFGVVVPPGNPRSLAFEVDPAWIRQQGQVRLRFAHAGRVLAEEVIATPGLHRVELALPSDAPALVDVEADSIWSPRADNRSTDFRLLSVKLVGGCPDGAATNRRPFHYPPIDEREVSDYLRMGHATGEEYLVRWQKEHDAQTEFGVRFRAWQNSKVRVRDEPFVPNAEYQALDGLVADLTARGIAVAIVNAPESPLNGDYQQGIHYQAYLRFLAALAERYPKVRYYDLVNSLPVEDFNDPLHVSYVGALSLGPTFAHITQESLSQ
jgi:hypothetical protein